MGIFSCCISDRKSRTGEDEARHARIIEIYQQAEAEIRPTTQNPPPAYYEVVCDHLSGTTIFVEEKPEQPPIVTQPPRDTQLLQPRDPISRPQSPRTSIYSVPSTRLTDITAANTGTTITAVPTHQGDSPRSSLVFDSPPPSYYDGRSMRERSRSPSGQRHSDEHQHPVMGDHWLEGLILSAQREARQRNYE